MNKMIKLVNDFLEGLESLKVSIKEYCQDTEIPLDDRWAVFEKIGHIVGEHYTWVARFKSLPNEFIMYDGDYYCAERYQTIYVTNLLDNIEDGKSCKEGDYKSDKIIPRYAVIDVNAFKEEVLSRFIWSFNYDW